MRTISLFGEPLHRSFNKIPIGAFVAGVTLHIIGVLFTSPGMLTASFYVSSFGVVVAPFVAALGIIDWWRLPQRSKARGIAFGHGWLMISAVVTFFFSCALRFNEPGVASSPALALSLLGFALLLIGVERGGRLVTDYGISTEVEQIERPAPEYTDGNGLVHELPRHRLGRARRSHAG